jgi:cytochrome oxidase assembly protein ShyY1
VQQQPDENGVNGFPQREPIDIELSDGSHLGYAIQWFLFVPLLGGGYLHFLRKNAALGQGETS